MKQFLSVHRWTVTIIIGLSLALLPMVAMAQDGSGGGNTNPLDNLSDFALWAILGGAISSLATSVLNQAHWKSVTKFIMYFIVCTVVAAGDAYFKRELDFHNWSRALIFVLASGWVTFLAGKPAIKEIEVNTTLSTLGATWRRA